MSRDRRLRTALPAAPPAAFRTVYRAAFRPALRTVLQAAFRTVRSRSRRLTSGSGTRSMPPVLGAPTSPHRAAPGAVHVRRGAQCAKGAEGAQRCAEVRRAKGCLMTATDFS